MKAKVCSVTRPARLNEEYMVYSELVRPLPETERGRPYDDEAVPVVPRRNIFDVLNPNLFSNQFEEVV